MPDESSARTDSLWAEVSLLREQDLAEARAAYNEAVARAEHAFSQRLGQRVVEDIIARRDAASTPPPIEAP